MLRGRGAHELTVCYTNKYFLASIFSFIWLPLFLSYKNDVVQEFLF